MIIFSQRRHEYDARTLEKPYQQEKGMKTYDAENHYGPESTEWITTATTTITTTSRREKVYRSR